MSEDPAAGEHPSALLALRGAIGGTLMGLANLVPGISGGTMLLASGVYPSFIAAVAEVTTLRFRPRSLLLLASVGLPAAAAIGLLAGTLKGLVEDHRWIMYSLFIGLTLGGAPLLWRMARPATPGVWLGALIAFGLMVAMASGGPASPHGVGPHYPLLFVAGLAASAAMILPGVSGGYLLLLLGQYEPILGSIDQLVCGLFGRDGAPADLALVLDALRVVVPLGIGVGAGVVGVSNLLRWLLSRFEKPTLGVLLGLLLGAVVGLWPFQEPRPPEPGDVIRGHAVTLQNAASFPPERWPLDYFTPSAAQVASSLALCAAGLVTTLALGRLGREDPAPSEV